MEQEDSLAVICKKISGRLIESMHLLDILEDISGDLQKAETIISIVQNNIRTSFNDIENCRQKIYICD